MLTGQLRMPVSMCPGQGWISCTPCNLFQKTFSQITRDFSEFAQYPRTKLIMLVPALGSNAEIIDRADGHVQTRPMPLQRHQVTSSRAYLANHENALDRVDIHDFSHFDASEPHILASICRGRFKY